jgi:Cellulase (glycosyl hydrolase family 5)
MKFKFMSSNRKLIFSLILFFTAFILLTNNAYSKNSENGFRIAIFKENGFPTVGLPEQIKVEWIYEQLTKNFSVTYLDSSKLNNKQIFNSDNFDLLIMSYGEAFPQSAFDSIAEYLFKGGGLLNIAGRPFWSPMIKISGRWQKADIVDPYTKFLAPLGIKYYEYPDKENTGLSVTTSLSFSPVEPTQGNVFPYRIPAREFYAFEDSENKTYPDSAIFVKSWINPYVVDSTIIPHKWCLINSPSNGHPLDLRDPQAQSTLMRIVNYLSFPVILSGLETDLAAYSQGEEVNIRVFAINSGKLKETAILNLDIFDAQDQLVYHKSKPLKLENNKEVILHEIWKAKVFNSPFYKIRATLNKDNVILDKEENGFVVLNKDVLRNGPSIQIAAGKFVINGQKSLILGVNYYESHSGELFWLKPNLLRVREDFKAMRKLGLNFVRIHYHHSKWFRDYFSQVVKDKLDPYLQVADTTVLPSERSLRILDAIIQLAQEQGLVFCMDIFSLVPQEMGNPIGWLILKERIVDKDKIAQQKAFVRVIAQRYKDAPGITWDLWNEPRLADSDLGLLKSWAVIMKDEFRRNQDTHLITIGDNLSLQLLDVLDYASVHTDKPEDFIALKSLGKPFIFQEVWNESGSSLDDELRQAERLKKQFNDFLSTSSAGFVPWQWTRQARLWDNASLPEKWDDELGLCVHEDGTLKVAGRTYAFLIKKLLNH